MDEMQSEEALETGEPGQWMSIKQVASEFNYSYNMIYKYVREGRIRAYRPTGGGWRIPRSEIERMRRESAVAIPRSAAPDPSEIEEIEVPPEMAERVDPSPVNPARENSPDSPSTQNDEDDNSFFSLKFFR